MIDKKKATVSTVGQAREPEKVSVLDINECNESEDKGDFTIEYPYKIELADSNGKTIVNERTQRSMRAKDWNKKFYFNDKGFPVFTRDHMLLAICEIKKAITKKDLPKELDLNSFIGFEFDAVVVRMDKGNTFIDWVATFQANGIEVPESENEKRGETKDAGKGAW